MKDALTVLLSVLTVWACLLGAAAVRGQAPHRFGFGHDGNWYDRDDVFASAVQSHIVLASGKSWRMTHFDFDDHGPESKPAWVELMRGSTVRGPWAHFSMVDCKPNRDLAVANLRREIAASTPTNTFWYGLCGPPDILYDATRGVPFSTLQNITVVSHSSKYNETDGGVHRLSQILGVRKIFIPNGNTKLNTKQNWAPWQGWMHPFDYERGRKSGRADCSDSTVGGYIVHGKWQTTIADLKGWIGQ